MGLVVCLATLAIDQLSKWLMLTQVLSSSGTRHRCDARFSIW